ncbi:MAG: rod shape-determining protein MreD [Flavobacteriaceae bacterium]|jgi:rod shape-determining protein MreD|nr:rod shape-determining protein MreD [Flavobacteriaceae bacterium]MBT6127379.1 rod shape-determining protein MreD [Flavobacteriaceae bacterium]MDG1027767.1 rod shape-determining protein MreD [Flavobacteriaceae bacterium]MDG1941442.1 rod shape-determining protein MreD [Flavobacteriaceae bacterium]|tara:strand:- start:919 stop:1425 length:507 start_codon:yes stop_codon:yes gene_type:complete
MNRDNIISIFQFLLLLLLQAFLLNNINFFGFINPNLYLLFILVYRLDGNPTLLIILGFVMGLLLDLLTQGSGGHTIATLTIAFIRPFIIRFSFGVNYDVPMGMIKGSLLNQRLLYLSLMVVIHHLVLYSVVYFSFENIITILKNTLFTSFFTFILVYISLGLFKEKND